MSWSRRLTYVLKLDRRRRKPQCANHDLAPNDMRFFKNTQEFTKTYLKKIRKKRFPSE